ncbi:hypothetical protein FB451DRAFT_1400402 [Mycena latifolia]|nr:hypothetical protein FB451DRAFT_1400402 [Mycena latifolia]
MSYPILETIEWSTYWIKLSNISHILMILTFNAGVMLFLHNIISHPVIFRELSPLLKLGIHCQFPVETSRDRLAY